MSRSVLMIAFHFPPAAMSSGHLRTLGFARYLPAAGWDPVVLSAWPMAYPRTAPIQAGVVPEGCPVYRAAAFDVRRHFGFRGKYPGFLAQPDGWASWWPAAVMQGLRAIRRHRISAIWSTYPIMTAHRIAFTLSARTGLPWIADFRDPVSSSVEAGNPYSVASQRRWENRVMERATRVVLTTPGAERAYAKRYPELVEARRLAVIENGFDDADLVDLPTEARRGDGPLVLLHSGVLYQDGRDPSAFFEALARLKQAGRVASAMLRVVLRASGNEGRYQQQLEALDIADLVELAPPIGNRDALREQAHADGLLLFQGSRFDRQIPAKLYEYLRIGKPIFGLVGEDGDTAALLRGAGGAELVPLHDASRIEQGLARFVQQLAAGHYPPGPRPDVQRWSRQQRACELAGLLDEIAT